MATSKHTTITRRAALKGGVSVIALAGGAAAAVAAVPTVNPDAVILDAEKRAAEIIDYWRSIPGPGPDDDESNALGDLTRAQQWIVGDTPAHTPEGMLAKLRLVHRDIDDANLTPWERRALETLADDIKRIGGAA